MNDTYSASQSGSSIYYNASTAAAASSTNATNTSSSPTANQSSTNTAANTATSTQPTTAASSSNSNLINDMFSQLSQLNNHFINYQNSSNEKINELSLKLNYINDSIEGFKQNLSNLNQQVLLLMQNPSLINGSFASFNATHNKLLEVFNKHLSGLGKEIEELAISSTVPAASASQHPQLQSQHHLNPHLQPATLPQARQPSTSHPSGYPEEDVDVLNRPPFSKAVPTSVSNPTSPFISNRFNFDIANFPTTRNPQNSFPLQPPPPNQAFHSIQDTINLPNNLRSNSNEESPDNIDKSLGTKPRKRRRSSKSKSLDKSQLASSSSYILPLPTTIITNEDDPSSQTKSANNNSKYFATASLPSNSGSTQFISVNRAGDDVLSPDMRHQQGQNRTNYFPAEIDHNIQGLNDGSQTNNANEASETSHPSATNENDESDKKTKSPKKRKKTAMADSKTSAASGSGGAEGISEDSPSMTDLPKCKLERSLKTISDIWKEYEYGLNDKPPLRLMEIKYGTKWRNETESRTFLRRKKIYEAIETGKSKGFTEEQIINDLEEYRSYDNNGTIKKKPLSWLCSNVPEKYNS